MKIFIFLIISILGITYWALAVEIEKKQTPSYTGMIQQWVDQSSPHDTLTIPKGHYTETEIVISKPITIIGEHGAIIDAKGKGQVLRINSDSVTIQHLSIRGSGTSNLKENAGIRVEDASHVKISGCTLEKNFFGIYLANASNIIILKNQLTGGFERETNSGNGIHLWQCDSIQIENNDVRGHRDAIYLEFVSNSTISDNRCQDNLRYGLHFMFSNNDLYTRNLFTDNGAGVAVMYSHGVDMHRNIFKHNQGAAAFGILLKDISDSRITNNVLEENSIAIRLEGTNRIEVSDNLFEQNGWAVLITANCSENHFYRNNFKFNSFDVSTNGHLVLNSFDGNYWDKYEGYDLNKDGSGDVPYHPVSLFATVVSEVPEAIMLYRSFTQYLLDRAEKVLPQCYS
jgi:nitrous oxidase accessory protein